ncbi:YicC family protein [Psychromarinibacter sp. C21-152]|uniref:YicC family protein n=1 Tax=Psychromarinibacter sediminicola TaxID=3033385 RepID=A0AAE3NQE3_9RHOB|nr:YicC/YloC family endoribonuclease [Psychromarinibacter sediminicola]MDF0600501.1 YicC family protein [Psychromarinibacter sediminicola]
MTGFAALKGAGAGFSWAWDMRAVNARGLDVRVRVPDWVEGLDQPVRAAVAGVAARGNVTVGLRLTRDEGAGGDRIDRAALARVLEQLGAVDAAAAEAGVTLARPTTAEVLATRGVLVSDAGETDLEPLTRALTADLPKLVEAFDAMRRSEGESLKSVIGGQLDRIEALTAEAARLAEARRDEMAAKLRDQLARVLDNAEGADADRVAQELALIAVKSDVTEEIDRLNAHVKAARDLLETAGAIGRKLDFLSQEFNREANTLCSKAQSSELTRVGLDLKATIDQMREQVQNVE